MMFDAVEMFNLAVGIGISMPFIIHTTPYYIRFLI